MIETEGKTPPEMIEAFWKTQATAGAEESPAYQALWAWALKEYLTQTPFGQAMETDPTMRMHLLDHYCQSYGMDKETYYIICVTFDHQRLPTKAEIQREAAQDGGSFSRSELAQRYNEAQRFVTAFNQHQLPPESTTMAHPVSTPRRRRKR
jgi:hypothetical protein